MRSRLVATSVTISAVILAPEVSPRPIPEAEVERVRRRAAVPRPTSSTAGCRSWRPRPPRASRSARRPPCASTGSVKLTGMDRVENGKVLVNVYVNGSVVGGGRPAARTRDGGHRDQRQRHRSGVVAGWLPADELLTQVAALTQTRAVLASHGMADVADGSGGTDTGSVLSQGDAAQHGPQARAARHDRRRGQGRRHLRLDQRRRQRFQRHRHQRGDRRPARRTRPRCRTTRAAPTRAGRWPRSSTTRPRASPDGVLDRARSSAAGKATSINNLVGAGVKVIADDIFYPDEPMFQDGIVAQAVDAAKAAGVDLPRLGRQPRPPELGGHLQPVRCRANDFDPGAGVDTVQTIGTFTNRSPFLVAPVGRAVGPRHHRPGHRRLHRRCACTRHRRRQRPRVRHPAGDLRGQHHRHAHPRHRHPAGRRHRHAVAEVHRRRHAGVHRRRVPDQLQRDQPGRRVGDRLARGGGQPVHDADHARAVQLARPDITRYFDKDGNPLATPEVRDQAAARRAPTGSRTTLPGQRAQPVLRHQRRHAERCRRRDAAPAPPTRR